MGDSGESYCADDPTLDEIDWESVQLLERKMAQAYQNRVGEDRSWAMLELLTEMYDDELRVL